MIEVTNSITGEGSQDIQKVSRAGFQCGRVCFDNCQYVPVPFNRSRYTLVIPATAATERQGHASDYAKGIPLGAFDAIVTVSGDGLIHEVLNGLALHDDPMSALNIPIAPIPAGSGNGLCLNLIGLKEGFDSASAALNVVKGVLGSANQTRD